MAARKTEATASSFVELLQQQIDILQGGIYEYTHLNIYTAGADDLGHSARKTNWRYMRSKASSWPVTGPATRKATRMYPNT